MPGSPGFVSSDIVSEHSVIGFLQDCGQTKAVKRLRVQTPDTVVKWQNEVNVLRKIRGPNYVAMLLDFSAQDFTITLRCEAGQSLDMHIDATTRTSTMTKEAANVLWLDVARALTHVHSDGIIHDDVKPENIMWDAIKTRAVLIDFGAAGMNDQGGCWDFNGSGTPSYVAPEFLNKQKGPPSDVWALGVTMLFAKGQLVLPDGDWFLPQVFEEGPDRVAMLAWWHEVESARRQLGGGDAALVRMLETDVSSRITSSSLVILLDVQQGPSIS